MNGIDIEVKKEFGDYQTPIEFSRSVCEYLHEYLKIEPTCGLGNFLKASHETFTCAESFVGIEINKNYCESCKRENPDNKVRIMNENFFEYNMSEISNGKDNVLVIGNPPWATNSELVYNLPQKTNFKGLVGTDAITGASNFDICEYIILKLIEEYRETNTTISMLCKTSVARNVFQETYRKKK